MSNEIVTDRSRILALQRCPRMRFYEYHCLGTGIRHKKLTLALEVGTLIHLGRSYLLEGKDIEQAVELTLMKLDEDFKSAEIDLELSESQLYVYEEQRAFVEAAIRVWYFVMFPKVMEDYEVVSIPKATGDKDWGIVYEKAIEPEIEWTLSPPSLIISTCTKCNHTEEFGAIPITINKGKCVKCGEETIIEKHNKITFMSRPDSILRSKTTKGIVVDSFKTTSMNSILVWNEEGEQVDKNKYDDQGISELIAVEKLLEEEVESIRMEFFIKGSRKKSTYYNLDGTKEQRKMQQSFLVHPWKKDSIAGVEYATKWEWRDELGYTKKLGKGWVRVDIWKDMPIKEWIDILISDEDNYSDLNELFITPFPYNRSTEDIEEWLDSVRYQESQVARHLDYLRAIEPKLVGYRESEAGKSYKKALNEYFPKNRENCYSFGRFCNYASICWEGNRANSGDFESRIPHHQKELVQLTKGGS